MEDTSLKLSSDAWNLKDDETIFGYLIKIEEKIYFITNKKVEKQYIEIYKKNKANERLKLNQKCFENKVYFNEVLNEIENENVDNDYKNYPDEFKKAINNFKNKNKKIFTTCHVIFISIFIFSAELLLVYSFYYKKKNNPYPNSQKDLNKSIPIQKDNKVFTEIDDDNPHDDYYYVIIEDNTKIYNSIDTIHYNNSNIKYKGPFKNKRAHGKGTYYDKNKNMKIKFNGIFKDGWFKSGTFYSNSGNYTGDFKKSKFEGRGIFLYNNGDKYNGTWKNNFRVDGRMDFANRNIYDGHWANNADNKPEGNGSYNYSNGDFYKGEFKNGLKDGEGKYYQKDGGFYIGSFKKDLKEGKGKEYYGEEGKSNYYVGEFKNNLQDGEGEYYWINGGLYNGSWKEGLKEGRGKLYYGEKGESDYYDGEFKNDLRDGEGVYFWKDSGEKYDGKWKDNKREGEGKLYYADKYYYQGHWVNDKREGKGAIKIKKNGKTEYSGDFKNDHYNYRLYQRLFGHYPHD